MGRTTPIYFEDRKDFTPSYSPCEMAQAGVFGGSYFGNPHVKENWQDFVPQEFLDECDCINLLTKTHYDKSINKYGVECGMDYEGWIKANWIREQDPYGWYNWYINFYYGRRSEDDERQISRWKSFISRHSGLLKSLCHKKSLPIEDESVGLKVRQGLLHWGYKI